MTNKKSTAKTQGVKGKGAAGAQKGNKQVKGQQASVRQRDFVDYYIELGNLYQAAIKAGYTDASARRASTFLDKPAVAEYLKKRTREMESRKIASADEVMKFLTRVMLGEEKDAFGLDASLTDRTAAAREIMKRHNAVKDNNKDALQRLDEVLDSMGGVI